MKENECGLIETAQHGGKRRSAGRPKIGEEPLSESPITFRPTRRQADYLGCALVLKIEPATIIRQALDKWIENQAG